MMSDTPFFALPHSPLTRRCRAIDADDAMANRKFGQFRRVGYIEFTFNLSQVIDHGLVVNRQTQRDVARIDPTGGERDEFRILVLRAVERDFRHHGWW